MIKEQHLYILQHVPFMHETTGTMGSSFLAIADISNNHYYNYNNNSKKIGNNKSTNCLINTVT